VNILLGEKKDIGDRTKTAKKTLSPEWLEKFEFALNSLEGLHTEIQMIVIHADKHGGEDYLGEITVVFKDIKWNDPTWFKLHSTTAEEASGELELCFAMEVKADK